MKTDKQKEIDANIKAATLAAYQNIFIFLELNNLADAKTLKMINDLKEMSKKQVDSNFDFDLIKKYFEIMINFNYWSIEQCKTL